ncbi:Gpi1 domain-containing protein [Cephalotus follicularis]|uniref:Gpi1 domain-containing protein n=1 Tax=Cephalotus follicularis TaxID=3775 RepID=A0A1Q3CRB9_CEPFO|nr:Gpi1 domain-containing protein [Cephalotus follicularis]
MRRKCRIWWPKDLSLSEPSATNDFLFGWFISASSASIDVVVAFAYNEASLSRCPSGRIEQEILHDTNGMMPMFLQNKSKFSLLGQCAANIRGTGHLLSNGIEENERRKSSNSVITSASDEQDLSRKNRGQWICGCHELHGLLVKSRQASIGSSHWIHLVYDCHEQFGREVLWIPKLQHIHWNKQIVSQCDVHVIIYETPMFGSHHFSLCIWSSEQVKTPLNRPKWFNELHQKQPLNDLDTVILAINSVAATKLKFERSVGSKGSFARSIIFVWQLLAISMASLSTIYYILVQILHGILSWGSETWLYVISARLFSTTWMNIQVRCCQILYWPIYLQDNDLRSQSCVEFAEKAALHKHSMWSSLAADVLLGNSIGFALLFYADSACLWILKFANDITNELLRSGCVWLMGVPAGFKLNTELAGALGMICLHTIQIWSALWIFVGFLSIYLLKGLAILGILFGATIPAALIIDIIALATLHVSTLYSLISILYSLQIQVLAALWRLFRGRKWNPLRERLDSYDYSVKQHVVGSLLFTPVLLLLPTTSVFYIYYTILKTAICIVCILIEVTISVIHATPYIKILLWMLRPRRFPSGIWFEIASCRSDGIHSPEVVSGEEIDPPSENLLPKENMCRKRSCVLVSILHSNNLSIGQILLPHYRKVFSGVLGFLAKSAYAVLTGKRIASTLGTDLPPTMPWMFIPYKEYWHQCLNSILACVGDGDCSKPPTFELI